MEMATNDSSPPKVQRSLKGFTTILASAACEWFLIFLLFIDAALSYLLTRFAHYCELQIPCILCSRLDHVFGNEKPGFYWNLLCSNHRSEISSLISCNIHGKLVDCRGMCENCLSSHIEENKSNSDMRRLFLGKLGFNPQVLEIAVPRAHFSTGILPLLLNVLGCVYVVINLGFQDQMPKDYTP